MNILIVILRTTISFKLWSEDWNYSDDKSPAWVIEFGAMINALINPTNGNFSWGKHSWVNQNFYVIEEYNLREKLILLNIPVVSIFINLYGTNRKISVYSN